MAGVKGEGDQAMSARPRRRSGNLSVLKLEIWSAIKAASAIMGDPDNEPELRLRAASAVATAGGVYIRILAGSETEDRVADLEVVMQSIVEQARNGNGPQ
jgi:hypothetical protein